MCCFYTSTFDVLVTVAFPHVVKSGTLMPSALFLLLRIALVIQDLLGFQMYFIIIIFISVRNSIEILVGTLCISLWQSYIPEVFYSF